MSPRVEIRFQSGDRRSSQANALTKVARELAVANDGDGHCRHVARRHEAVERVAVEAHASASVAG
ncbi:MAG TPA: hypothetical protein VEK55_14610 [Xanthobacteraceae bacterium]|nr:hypothetical protein [Xanthobacteraceae bacterium]